MARVTVEDCVDKVPSRFELVVLAAKRSRQIAAGSPLFVERDHDKNPVVALREIASEKLDIDKLRDSVIDSFQEFVPSTAQDDELDSLLDKELAGEETEDDMNLEGMMASIMKEEGKIDSESSPDDAEDPESDDIDEEIMDKMPEDTPFLDDPDMSEDLDKQD